MSEKIEQFVEKLKAQLSTVEANLATARERIAASSQESADAMHAKIDEVTARIAVIKQQADAKSAELREKLAKSEGDAKANIEQQVEKLRENCNAQINDLQKSWGDTVTDLTGGVIF